MMYIVAPASQFAGDGRAPGFRDKRDPERGFASQGADEGKHQFSGGDGIFGLDIDVP